MLEMKKGSELKQRYVISDLLGSGGYSIVWRATDKTAGRDVAIKRLTKIKGNDLTTLLEEARATSRLKGHKNIVEIYEVFQEEDEGILVMEYVDGSTLEDTFQKHILAKTWLEKDEALEIFEQVLDGLLFAHSSGVYHCDMKPSNILISKLGAVKLVDFGLAKYMAPPPGKSSSYEAGFARTGTANFMSTEQANGFHLDHRTDIFSAGIVGYILLTGRHPFNHPSGVASIFELIKNPTFQCDELVGGSKTGIPEGVATAVMRMLRKDVSQRSQSVLQALDELAKDPAQSCSRCSAPNPVSNIFCGQCGNPLKGPTGSPTDLTMEPPEMITKPKAEELTEEGFGLTRLGDWEGARAKYRQAIEADPSYARAYANLGYALNKVGAYEDAIKELSIGIERTSDHALLHRLHDARGFARSNLKEFEAAIDDFTVAIEYNSRNPRIYYHRGESKALAGKYREAHSDVLEALQLDPEFMRAIRLRQRLEAQGYVKPLSLN